MSALGLIVSFVAAADVALLEVGFSDISIGDVDAILAMSDASIAEVVG